MGKIERNFWLDWMMFIVFSITVVSGFLLWLAIPHGDNSAFAGIDRAVWLAFHVGSGFLGLLGVIVHIVWHWRWLRALRSRSLGTMKRSVRANRVVDRLTWISFIATNIFGLLAWLLSTGLPAETVKIFARFHVAAGIACLVFLAAHLVLHQQWVASAARHYLPFGLATNVKVNMEGQ
ncbi:MAG: DUF4405 domain-containing protein [Chloroflexi bacterium]|nr:DUF4405 domain-containing protein [Chloroflexota bacterium]